MVEQAKIGQVAILTYSSAALFELGCAVELFSLPRPEFENWYKTDVVSFDAGALDVTGRIQIIAHQISSLAPYDTLVVPSWPTDNSRVPDKIQNELLEFYGRGGRLISFCSGAFLLAETGLLDARQATTHWRQADKFKSKYPKVNYVDDVLYIYKDNIGCSAGSSAGLDLGIEVIRRDFGYRIANQVARRLVIPAHRQGGQSQYVETPIIERPNQFAASLDWALKNLKTPITVNQMAARAKMSRRTFDRKFKSSLNLTPKDWIIEQRLRLAKQLLESSNYSIEVIANLSGFESAMTLRHNFRKRLRTSPGKFREKFSGKLASDT